MRVSSLAARVGDNNDDGLHIPKNIIDGAESRDDLVIDWRIDSGNYLVNSVRGT